MTCTQSISPLLTAAMPFHGSQRFWLTPNASNTRDDAEADNEHFDGKTTE